MPRALNRELVIEFRYAIQPNLTQISAGSSSLERTPSAPDAAETPDLAGAAAAIASRKKAADHRLNSKT
jgi:hypothetical protein